MQETFGMASQSFVSPGKRAKCSSDESEMDISVPENQGLVDCRLDFVCGDGKERQQIYEDEMVCGGHVLVNSRCDEEDGKVGSPNQKEKDMARYELGLSGVQESGEVRKGSSLISAHACGIIDETQSEVKMDGNKYLSTSSAASDQNESQLFLKNREKHCLAKPQVTSCSDVTTFVSEPSNFESSGELIDDIKHSSIVDEKGSSCEELLKVVQSDTEKLDGLELIGSSFNSDVDIERAVSQIAAETQVGDICRGQKGSACYSNHSEKNGDGNEKLVKQELDGKKEKRSRRRVRGGRKVDEAAGKEHILCQIAEARPRSENNTDETKRVYSIKELEALRYTNIEGQRKKWIEVYCGLGPAMAEEYNSLVHHTHVPVNFDPRQQLEEKKEEDSAILGHECFQNVDNGVENINPFDAACGCSISYVDGCTAVEEECSEDEDSDEDYSNIQRPAFFVTGEPNFDNGPPEDGLEYLRRVRWEAAQIPKVKVAKLERSKLNKNQTVYMPPIPEIAKCPKHLLPMKQWVDEFLADFSELRLALSSLEDSCAKISDEVQTTFIQDGGNTRQLPSIIPENSDNITYVGVEPCLSIGYSIPKNSVKSISFPATDGNCSFLTLENSSPKSLARGSSGDIPTLSAILKMSPVARVSMLRNRIHAFETMSNLSRNDCAWLFALCAAVDTPLHADTCAALRCLLRKSSSLLAAKSELDDEVVMLNILATVSGRYFGQSEN